MNKLIFAAIALALSGCAKQNNQSDCATFDFFEYKGEDPRFNKNIDTEHEYFNPIIAGFYPDPSVCRKGDDYYLVNSTFAYFPGIPIFHSKDLVHWEQIGHVLNRPSQLDLDSLPIRAGLYAPTITYNPYNDTFYLINTNIGKGGNFFVKTKNPMENNWSDPIWLPEISNIDPSFIFDDDGKAYIVHNGEPPKKLYEGHGTLVLNEFDVKTDKVIGEPIVLVDGGVDKSKNPTWIEGPHIYKINGKYYLMAAEGGTGIYHSEVMFVSDNIKGKYTPVKINPILTQRNLPENREDKVTSTGHADIIQTPDGQWYAVFLGCRPYKDDMYNTGRETFLLPFSWKDNQPVILEKDKAVPTIVKQSENWRADKSVKSEELTGNFTWRDDFNDSIMNLKWVYVRAPQNGWLKINNGKVEITPTSTTIYEMGTPAFVARRQQHTNFTVTTQMNFDPKTEKELAGLVCYQTEKFNIVFGKTIRGGKQTIVVESADNGNCTENGAYTLSDNEIDKPLFLKIIGRADKYSFEISVDGTNWKSVAENVNADNLSTYKNDGFTGSVIGMYAVK